jgi:serine phosphatase RsbU (regulator of sigma subunit)
MPANLPFPIAYSYHLIDTGRTPESRYRAVLQCYEAAVRYCAAVQLSDYLASGCPDPTINRLLLDRLGRNFSLGHWVELTRKITAQQRDGLLPAFMPELAEFYFKPDKGLSPEGEIFDNILCNARNEAAHPDYVWTTTTCEHKFNEHKAPHLDRLLRALRFLENYPLYVPYVWRRSDVVNQAIVLMGPFIPLRLKSDLKLKLSSRLREGLEDETTAFLTAPDDPGRQLLLYPLSVFHRRGDSEDIFLFENCELGRKGIKWLLYRAFSLGQAPLEITPGHEHARLVEHFRAVLRALGDTAARPEEERVDELSGHYFSAQRDVIRDRTRAFVGREYVEAAFDRFTEGHHRGYFIIRGGPGQGKTAVACQLIKKRHWVHHLVCPTGGRNDSRLILRSLLAQLIPVAGRPARLPETVPELTKQLEDILGGIAGRGQRLVLVIDGLDELPADTGDPPPFLVTSGLPEGVYYVLTSRPGERVDRLIELLPRADRELYDLGALQLPEMAAILRVRGPDLGQAEVERIAEASQGNPQYLLAVAEELARDPHFDVRVLPTDVEEFFRRATGHLRRGDVSLGRDVLGLLSVARKPLTPRELGQITGQPMRLVHEHGLRPVRQFLFETEDGYSFYHSRFRDFVARELLYEDELPHYHGRLAVWLCRSEARSYDYHWSSLAYHMFESGDLAGLLKAVDEDFLRHKVRRFGYAVLEDVELLTRALMEANEPSLVNRCVALVEGLRAEAGGDIIENIRETVQAYRPGPASFRSRLLAPSVPSVPGLDMWVGMLPKVEVGADFFEVIPRGDRLVLVLGDAPGAGLKPAFVARFLGNSCRRLVEQEGLRDLGEVLGQLNALFSGHDYFETAAMQCVEIDPRAGLLTLANAGLPPPVLYSAHWRTCDVLPVRGTLLHSVADPDAAPRWQQRRAEIAPGDVLVMVTDGLTEGHRIGKGAYSYRFKDLITKRADEGARAVGEAILDDWRAYPREGDYADDVTLIVAAVTGAGPR